MARSGNNLGYSPVDYTVSHRTPKPISRRRLLKRAVVGTALVSVPFGFGATDWLSVERTTLQLPKWDADGFKVAFLSDFHLHDHNLVALTERAVQMTVEEKPDVVLLGGDFIDARRPHGMQRVTKTLAALSQARCPIYAVLGNHDYAAADLNSLIQELSRPPFHLLRNQTAEVRGVTIGGLDDAIMGLHRFDSLLQRPRSRSFLCMLHEPDFCEEAPDSVSLQISGHSHGGQVCLPGGISLHTPRGARKYISGYYADARVPLYVSRGIGTTGPHIRTFCRPEISILTLKGA